MATQNSAATELEQKFEEYRREYSEFVNKGNKSAGTRARKALSDVGRLVKDVRNEIQENKNN